jgi:hypothetical protein
MYPEISGRSFLILIYLRTFVGLIKSESERRGYVHLTEQGN